MRDQILACVLSCVIVMSGVVRTPAFETDQYNLSPEPLTDIGDEMSAHIKEAIALAVKNLNDEIAFHESCVAGLAAGSKTCRSLESEKQKLAALRTDEAITKAVFKMLGEGSIFTSATGKWFENHKFQSEPSRYKTSYGDSIFLTRPVDYLTISPTVRMFGSEFGFDKIDHFFQQGYKYYRTHRDAIAGGKTDAEATKKAVDWGKRTERTYFGTLVSGVYSNADIFANFAGMRFYQGLTNEITVSGRTRPRSVILKDGRWSRNQNVDLPAELLRPFVSDHLNEAFNPSGYTFFLHKIVRKVVRERACPEWQLRYPAFSAEEFKTRASKLETWNGEDYGFTRKSKTVPIAICFQGGDQRANSSAASASAL